MHKYSTIYNGSKILILCILLVTGFHISAQNQDSIKRNLSMRSNYGFVSPVVTKPSKYYYQSRATGFELYYGKSRLNDTWSSYFRNPDHGPGISFYKLEKSHVLGNNFTLFYQVNIPIFIPGKAGFYYTTSIGCTYVSNPFDPENNYLNLANGSALNVFAHFGFHARIFLFSKGYLRFGTAFYHISNGNIKLPNNGLNVVNFNAGLGLYLNQKSNAKPKIPSFVYGNHRNFMLTMSLGSKQAEFKGDNYLVTSLSGDYELIKLNKRSIGAGMDFIYDKSYQYSFLKDTTGNYTEDYYFYNSLYAFHALRLNRVMILTSIGFYLDYMHLFEDRFFYYLGFRYFIVQDLYFNFGLKAKFQGGDFLGWGIGYAFN